MTPDYHPPSMVPGLDEIQKFRIDVFHDLRAELGHLKTCQTTLLVFSSTGAGIFLGLMGNANTNIPQSYLVLLPLIFLLPLWIIFYEKARTISRIVGFLRIQEKLYMLQSTLGVIGWESAMELYRTKGSVWDDRGLDKEFPVPQFKSSTSPYWFWVFFTFSALCLTCLALSLAFLPVGFLWKIAILGGIAGAAVLVPILELDRIGKQKQDAGVRRGKHRNLDIFSRRARFLAAGYGIFSLILLWIAWFLVSRSGPAGASSDGLAPGDLLPAAGGLGISFLVFCVFIVLSLFSGGIPPVFLFGAGLVVSGGSMTGLPLSALMGGDLQPVLWTELIPSLVFCSSFAFFLYTMSIASWMYLNLVKGRYSYSTFSKRWQIILNIQYNETTHKVQGVDWEERLNEIRRQAFPDSPSPAK